MPITTIDPKTALIIVDLQNGILSAPVPNPMDQVVKNSRALADAFRSRGLPVVLVKVVGGAPGRKEYKSAGSGQRPADWTEFVPELNQQPEDIVVTKRTWGAFTNTGLEDDLKKLGVTQVVVTGCATSVGAESTARQAHECGFNVTLATDAMSDVDENAHINSVTRIFPRLGETGPTRDIIDLMDRTAA
jgi:nicotinamidase-related amidase